MRRKFLAGLLSLCLMFSLFPTAVFAAECGEGCVDGVHVEGCENAPVVEETTETPVAPVAEEPAVDTKTPPQATVTSVEMSKLDGDSYICYPSGDTKIERPLDIVVNFAAQDETAPEYYARWICDFYIKVTGLESDSFIANNCYLAGYYPLEFLKGKWVVIPMDGIKIEKDVVYPVVSGYDANITYEQVCNTVKSFTAAIHIAPEIFEANSNMEISLELRMTNPENSNEVLVIGEPLVYSAEDFVTFVASANGKKYTSLQNAINAANGGTVTLLKDVTDDGVVIDKPVTIDFGGFTYTTKAPTVGSEGTKTQCFQILKEAGNVTFKNGTIEAYAETAKMIIQNYANLTLTDMNLIGKEGVTKYVLSNNNGTVNINGATNITAPAGAVAFDVYDYKAGGYSGVNVTVDTTGTITGMVEVDGDGTNPVPKLTINNGTFVSDQDGIVARKGEVLVNKADITAGSLNNGSWCAVWADGGKVVIKDGTFTTGADADGKGNDTIYTKHSGTVDIYGGTFSSKVLSTSFSPDQYSVLNENDANRGTIKVYGGTFEMFNPANNSSEGPNTNFVVAGYESVEKTANEFTVGKHDPQPVAEKAATCTEAGTKAHEKCDFCGRIYLNDVEKTEADLVLSKADHTPVKDAAVAAGCGTTGLTEGSHCGVCGKVLVAQTTVAATGKHNFGGWERVTNPTCTEKGQDKHTCGNCGHVEFCSVAVAGHSYGADGKCTACGNYDASKVVATPAPTVAPTVAPTTAPTATPAPEATPQATQAPAMPTEADTTVTEVVATEEVVTAATETVVVSEGTATVDAAAVEKIVEATAEEETAVVIPVAQVTEEVVNKAEVDTEALTTVAEAEKDVVIELTDVTVKLDAEAVKAVTEQAGGKTIEIRAVKAETHTLTETQQAAIADKDTAIVVTAQIFSDGEYIGDFKGGKATIKLPFTPEEGKAGEDHSVYFIDDNGEVTKVPSEYVDGHMVFTTSHFSDYAIVYEGAALGGETETVVPEAPAAESSFPIIPIVVVIAIIVVGGVVLMMKKRNAED